jgi:hypothetical protein
MLILLLEKSIYFTRDVLTFMYLVYLSKAVLNAEAYYIL